jgi:hypothetical protein
VRPSQLLEPLAVCGVQDCTDTFVVVGVLHVVAVQLLMPLAVAVVQVPTGVGPELLSAQVIVIQLVDEAVWGLQTCTGTLDVVTGVGHVVVVQLLPNDATCAVQLATGTLVVTAAAGQLIVSQLLPELPVCEVQD